MRQLILCLALVSLAFGQTTYPGAVDTDANLKITKNGIITSIRHKVAPGDSIISVYACTDIEPHMLLTLGRREIVEVTAVGANCDLTVARAFDGTAAITHNPNAEAASYPTAWERNSLKSAIVAIETALGPDLSNITAGGGTGMTPSFAWSQTPGGSIAAAVINSVTLNPRPAGVAATNVGHYVYLSGGTGTAEAVLIQGGTCTTSGTAACSIIFTPAFSHTGAWTISGSGVQEAICALPAAGGDVQVTSDVTIQANIEKCGKGRVRVIRPPGITISGAFTLLGSSIGTSQAQQVFQDVPVWETLQGVHDGTQYSMGDYPDTWQWGFDLPGFPFAGSLVGSIDVAAGTDLPAPGTIAGVAGYGRTARPNAFTVGVYGGGVANGESTFAFGGNFTAQTRNGSVAHSSLTGIEADTNNNQIGANAPDFIRGVWVVANHPADVAPGGVTSGVSVHSVNTYNWQNGFETTDGAAFRGLRIGRATVTGESNSQLLQLRSRDAGGIGLSGSLAFDSLGYMHINGEATGGVTLLSGASTILQTSTTEITAVAPVRFIGITAGNAFESADNTAFRGLRVGRANTGESNSQIIQLLARSPGLVTISGSIAVDSAGIMHLNGEAGTGGIALFSGATNVLQTSETEVTAHMPVKFAGTAATNAFESIDNSAAHGLRVGRLNDGESNSQLIQLLSRSPGLVTLAGSLAFDSLGIMHINGEAGAGGVALYSGATNVLQTSETNISANVPVKYPSYAFASLPAAASFADHYITCSDCSTGTAGVTAASGATKRLLVSDGVNWLYP